MSRLQTPQHNKTRSVLRACGVIFALLGLIFLAIGMISFFTAFGHGMPRLFWCCFVGMPLLFVGIVMCVFGFMGAAARYAASEHVPVASDAVNDLADGTKGAVKTWAKAASEGIREGQQDKS